MNDPEDPAGRVGDLAAARRVFAALTTDEGNGEEDNGLPAVPGYTVLARLGHGGGGAVYRGMHEGSARPVAIKLLAQRLGSTAGSQRAWRELELLGQLHLSCLPKLLDYGEHDGRLFIVTELVEGLTLEVHCIEHALDRRQRVDLLARVGDALQLIHERGVIHRDIKPSNILIDPNGDPVLIDFGIAALVADDPKDTLATDGSPIGSPSFMSPEQARGERASISTRTDVYGLGAAAYQILLGQPPFDLHATLHEAIRRIAFDQPRGPHEIDTAFPRPLAAVLHKAVARNPGDRYASASDLAADLRRWLRREPVQARPPSVFLRLTRSLGRHPALATLGLCVAMLAGSVGGTYALVRWLNTQPFRVSRLWDDADSSLRAAMLESLSGRVLHIWSPGVCGASQNLLPMRDQQGDHLLAIVGFEDAPDSPDWSRKLCAFDVKQSVEEPYWSRSVTNDQLATLPSDRDIRADDFRVRGLDVQDYFPDRPGEEIAVNFTQGTYSWTVIQIYDLHGDLLYQFWHDGVIRPMYWMPGPGLLVLAGLNSEQVSGRSREAGWASRLPDALGDASHPRVLFAIRPREGVIGRSVLVADEVGPSGTDDVAWYRCLPRASLEKKRWGIRFLESPPKPSPRHVLVRWAFVGDGERAETSWTVDEQGRVVGTIRPNDAYRAAMTRGDIPHPPEFWQLGTLPPLLPPRESGGSPP